LRRVPSMTLGVKPRRPLPLAESSGSLMTSMARARLGRRRMKPRSSSAVMRRWMPDFERRSSASFISSKEGGTPASFNRSLMKRRSSYCLRVSISSSPPVAVSFNSETTGAVTPILPLETNHERTLYVRYVFRNTLISGESNLFARLRARGHLIQLPRNAQAASAPASGRRLPRGREVLMPQRVFAGNGLLVRFVPRGGGQRPAPPVDQPSPLPF